MEKVMLTKEQANEIEKMQENSSKDRIVSIRIRDETKFIGSCGILNDIDVNTLITALYVGYEVELTEQEEIDKIWYRHICDSRYREAVKGILAILGREDLIPNSKEE